ncbi:hypothetical protein [Salinirussus salinus]|uniref:hypothetical protein n=1 Tax=Salinirussus salinus TaxID=1198300 RepID=UPI0019168FB9|nr:hypothetical protein [Salinirussus salinus]
MDPREKHQGSQQSKPSGVIPRTERQTRHEKFYNGFSGVDTVMLPIDHAERLLRQGLTASSYTDKAVITTTTIPDEDLKDFGWEKERDIVEAFQPTYHIPTDYWVYGDMDPEDRVQNIELLMEGTEWMYEQMKGVSTEIIPLVKGYSPQERAICYRTLDKLGTDYVAFYGSQYFGGKNGGINALNEDVRDIVSEYSPSRVLLIGCQSENYMERLPPEVEAVAGQRWIRKSKLRDVSIPKARVKYLEWKQEVTAGLGSGQTTLGSFETSTEVTA